MDIPTETEKPGFSKTSLNLDVSKEVEQIVNQLRHIVHEKFHRQGGVVGISGGVDSAVSLALGVRALGLENVVGIMMPEGESSPESLDLAQELADQFGVKTVVEDITPALEGFGCYRRRDEALSRVFSEYKPGWKAKIMLPGDLLEQGTLNIFRAVVTSPEGQQFNKRLPPVEFRQIVAASNFKQRTRMTTLYYHAELRNFVVIGTTNKNENDLGFFVKYGDGGVDVDPIIHLFKTQVFQLARFLKIPQGIINRTPTTDTYPGGGSQEEFFYRIPFETLDLLWHGWEQKVPKEVIAETLGLSLEQVEFVINDIISKHRTTEYLRSRPSELKNRIID